MPGESKVIEAIFDHRWAILPSALEGMIAIANRQGSVDAALAGKAAYENNSPSTANTYSGSKNIAVIPVLGPIFPRANLMSEVSGATSTQKLMAQFKTAMEDQGVGGIILSVDSPGGEVTGVSELAQMIFEARGKKPITAYVQGMAASAAYWLSSAADEIIAADTAEAGSIGVIAAYSDDKEAQRKRGITTHEIVSSQSPKKRPDISTPEGRKQIQIVVDDLAAIFISTVARNRGVSEDHVLEEFGQGGTFVSGRAVDRGMVDKVGTFESVVKSLEAKIKGNEDRLFNGGFMSNVNANHAAKPVEDEEDPKGKAKDKAEEDTEDPKEEEAKGKAEDDEEDPKEEKSKGKGKNASNAITAAIDAERARIQGIETLKAPGYEAFIASKKWEQGMTKEKLSALILDDQETRRVGRGNAVRADAMDLAVHSAKLGNSGDLPQGSVDDAVVASMVAGANSRRR